MLNIGLRIRQLRELRGMTQVQVAAALGISAPSMSQIETGSTKLPRPTTLMKLAEVLETNQQYLLTGEGNQDQRDMVVADPVAMYEYELLNPQHKAAIKAMIITFRNIENA